MDPAAGSPLVFWLGLLASSSLVLFAVSRDDRRTKPPPDRYRTALMQILRNDDAGALESLRQVIQSTHAPPDAYIQLGNLLRARGEHQAAFQVHQSLTVRRDLQPDERAATLRALVEDYRAVGQREEALRTLEELATQRRDASVVAEMAREMLHLGRYDPAVALARELQKLDPAVGKSEIAVFLAAAAQHALEHDRAADAKRLLQQAHKEDDACPQALDLFGDLAMTEGDHESALYYWQKLVFAGGGSVPDVYDKLERVYFELGKFGEIERVYTQILERRPRDLQTLLASARIALKKGEAGDAERALRNALELAPRATAAFQMLVGLWLDEGKTREVRELVAAHVETCRTSAALVCPRCGTRADRQPGYCLGCGRFGSYDAV